MPGTKENAVAREGGEAGREPDAPRFRYTAALANEIESKWQARWEEAGVHRSPNPAGALSDGFDGVAGRPKKFILDMFPYPSGVGLHVGHPLGYIATDIYARFLRMTGHNVLHAMGYDAFGLPAEQYAVQTGQHPRVTTERNIANMRAQLKRLGLGHDDRRSVATTDVSFYRWTQWIFLQVFNAWFDDAAGKARPVRELVALFERGERPCAHDEHNPEGKAWGELSELSRRRIVDSHRLAQMREAPVNWCPALGTVLANEEVTSEGRSERGNYPVYKRPLKQWVMRITTYAERLLADLEGVEWPEPIKLMQRNWIGRSEGGRAGFAVEGREETIEVFTTRPDTLYGATYVVLAPEHPLVESITTDAWPEGTPGRWRGEMTGAKRAFATPGEAVAALRQEAAGKSDIQRQSEAKLKTGVFTGAFAVNPADGERVPIFIADYVLMGYGTGAIMAVPAHDDRDFEFAAQFDLPVRDVVYPRPVHAIRWFVEHVPDADGFPEGWKNALADFLGLIVESGLNPKAYLDALETVRARRRGGDGDVRGGHDERRGAIRGVWIETTASITSLGFAGMREVFMEGRHWRTQEEAFTGKGVCVNSPMIEGLPTDEAKSRMTEILEEKGAGERAVTYRLRDWLFSRQRYWGEPFPIVFDEHGLPVALPETMLPVELPEVDDFAPEVREDADASVPAPPLARATGWAEVTLNLGDGPKTYRRELNTMPQWAGSCWYYLRYLDPTNEEAFCAPENERFWMRGDRAEGDGGVDLYVGGAEHAVLHLLYARFWHKALYDLGHVSTREPFYKLFNQGYIQAHSYKDERGLYVEAAEVVEDPPGSGRFTHGGKDVTREYGKMGKGLKNAVAPDDIFRLYGADTLRLYEMYLGPLEASKPWNTRDIVGVHRFLQRVWRNIVDEETGEVTVVDDAPDEQTRRLTHRTIAGVREDMASLRFNTAIAKLIELNNELTKLARVPRETALALVRLLAPIAPHLCDELWERLGGEGFVVRASAPEADASLIREAEVELLVQVLGKPKARITAPADATEAELRERALAEEKVCAAIARRDVRKVIVVPGRLVNIVV